MLSYDEMRVILRNAGLSNEQVALFESMMTDPDEELNQLCALFDAETTKAMLVRAGFDANENNADWLNCNFESYYEVLEEAKIYIEDYESRAA